MYLSVHRLLQGLEGMDTVRLLQPPPTATTFAALAALAALAAFAAAASGDVGVRVSHCVAAAAERSVMRSVRTVGAEGNRFRLPARSL